MLWYEWMQTRYASLLSTAVFDVVPLLSRRHNDVFQRERPGQQNSNPHILLAQEFPQACRRRLPGVAFLAFAAEKISTSIQTYIPNITQLKPCFRSNRYSLRKGAPHL
jgi:hypothetical protein